MPKNQQEKQWDLLPDHETLDGGAPDRQQFCAARAKDAIASVFEKDTPSTMISDMLSDIRHLCDRLGLDYGEIDRNAYSNYSGEVSDARRAKRHGKS